MGIACAMEHREMYKTYGPKSDGCNYCNGSLGIDFRTADTFGHINNNEMIIACEDSIHKTKINYCPMCGKEL